QDHAASPPPGAPEQLANGPSLRITPVHDPAVGGPCRPQGFPVDRGRRVADGRRHVSASTGDSPNAARAALATTWAPLQYCSSLTFSSARASVDACETNSEMTRASVPHWQPARRARGPATRRGRGRDPQHLTMCGAGKAANLAPGTQPVVTERRHQCESNW